MMTICMEKITSEAPIIADTSALVSLATETDHNHRPAVDAAAGLSQSARMIILPSDVLVETVNVLGKRSSRQTALKVATELLRPKSRLRYMIRTQVYLTEEQLRDIKRRARRENKGEAQVTLELLREGMRSDAKKTLESTGDTLLRVAKIKGKGASRLVQPA